MSIRYPVTKHNLASHRLKILKYQVQVQQDSTHCIKFDELQVLQM